MNRPIGISFEMGVSSKGILHFHIIKQRMQTIRPWIKEAGKWIITPRGGFKFDIGIGTMRRPLPKFWKKEFWSKDYVTKEQNTNPWNSDNYWFVLTVPFMPYFFLSCCYGAGKRQPGFYFGFKTYKVTTGVPVIECQLKKYMPDKKDKFLYADAKPILTWCNKNDIGRIYLALSTSIRDDLVD